MRLSGAARPGSRRCWKSADSCSPRRGGGVARSRGAAQNVPTRRVRAGRESSVVSSQRAVSDDPSDWMASTRLVDLHDTKLRLKAQSLTQLSRTEREKALNIYSAVKRIPFAKPVKLRLRTAHEVLRAKRADAEDKATLFLAL